MVSSELETAYAVSQTIGVPAAKQTDVFADGQVQIVEFDVPKEGSARRPERDPADRGRRAGGGAGARRRLRRGRRPSAQARDGPRGLEGGEHHPVRADARAPRRRVDLPGDRIVVIGSPDAAREWGRIMARGVQRVDDVVVFGAGGTGLAIARVLLEQGIRVRLIESDEERAREVADELPAHGSTTRPASTPTSSSASASAMRARRCSPCGRTRRTSTRRCSPRCTASASRSGSSTNGVGRGLRARRNRRRRQPALGHGGGDRPLRPRPARSPAGHAGGRPLRDPRHHGAGLEQARAARRSRSCP